MRQLISQILYGSVETGIAAAETFIRLHLLIFYAKELELPSGWIGIALGISVLWDMAINPWVGRLSDHFKARNGTRVHLVLIGAIGTTLSLAGLYFPPHFEKIRWIWLYFLVMLLIFNSSLAFFSVPYTAMVGDYPVQPSHRARLVGWRLAFGNLGVFFGILIPGIYLAQSSSDPYRNASWLIAMIILLFSFLGSLVPPPLKKQRDPEIQIQSHPLLQAFKNFPFLVLLAAYFLVNAALILNMSMALYFFRLKLLLAESDVQSTLLAFLLFFTLGIPFWIWFSQKWGRKSACLMAFVILAIWNFALYYALPLGNADLALALSSGVGGFLMGSVSLLDVQLLDVIHLDQLKLGVERWGLYFGIWRFAEKFSKALSMVAVGILLDWANVNFPDIDTASRLTFIFGPGVGFSFFLAALFLLIYPLSEKKRRELQQALEKTSHGPNIPKLGS